MKKGRTEPWFNPALNDMMYVLASYFASIFLYFSSAF